MYQFFKANDKICLVVENNITKEKFNVTKSTIEQVLLKTFQYNSLSVKKMVAEFPEGKSQTIDSEMSEKITAVFNHLEKQEFIEQIFNDTDKMYIVTLKGLQYIASEDFLKGFNKVEILELKKKAADLISIIELEKKSKLQYQDKDAIVDKVNELLENENLMDFFSHLDSKTGNDAFAPK